MSEAWSQWEGHIVNGEFQLKKYLGGSEQSAVFLTEYRGQEPQPAAIKLIAAEPANAELQLSLWELAQRLSHPHLLRLLRTGRFRLDTRELIFAVMEYAEENLAQILPERPLTSQETREMLKPTLDVLTYLHGQGLVHGHLKPANVLAINDQLKLSSDSICRANETVSGPEKPSIYDSPEMASGVMSPAADVWSLGMTLAEVLTQHVPSWNDQDPADPALPQNLPAPFLDIVRGCLQRDPQRRWTITAIAGRLRAEPPQPPASVADAKPLPQKPPAVRSSAGSWVWRSAFPMVVAILTLAALLAGLGRLRRQPEIQPDVAAVKPQQKSAYREPDARKPSPQTSSPRTLSPKTTAKTDQLASSGDSRFQPAPAPQVRPQPASLQSVAQTPAHTGSVSDGGTNSGFSGGSGVGVVQQVLPNVPQKASDTIQGTIRVTVRVKVDPSGNEVGAELESPGPSKYFARLALEAAQKWKFSPYGPDNEREFMLHAGREFVLNFEFRNTGTRAFATHAGR